MIYYYTYYNKYKMEHINKLIKFNDNIQVVKMIYNTKQPTEKWRNEMNNQILKNTIFNYNKFNYAIKTGRKYNLIIMFIM